MATTSSPVPDLVATLGHRDPRLLDTSILERMIQVETSAFFSELTRTPDPDGEVAKIHTLPFELLHQIFVDLDIETLCNIKKASLRGVHAVDSMREFRDLVTHAPKVLAALGATGLLRSHTVSKAHATLLSRTCTSCHPDRRKEEEFAAFVFLPTLERCGLTCVRDGRPQCDLVPERLAHVLLRMPKRIVKSKLPTLHSLATQLKKRVYDLESPSQVKRLRLVHSGTVEQLAVSQEREKAETLSTKPLDCNANFDVSSKLSSKLYDLGRHRRSWQCWLAVMPMPWLIPGTGVEHGLWCRGCEKLYLEYWDRGDRKRCHDNKLERCWLLRISWFTKTEAGLLEHVECCEGAKQILSERAEEEGGRESV